MFTHLIQLLYEMVIIIIGGVIVIPILQVVKQRHREVK